MAPVDIAKTNEAVRRLLEVMTNPRHRFFLAAYDRHRNLEMARRHAEIFVPEMTVEHPVYHFNVFGRSMILDAREQVEAAYHHWAQTGRRVFYAEHDKPAAGDNMIVSTAVIYQQTPGQALTAAGVDTDAAASCLVADVEHMIWPYDDRGRLAGEDVREIDPSQRQIIRLDPAQVPIPQQAAERLGPLIGPLRRSTRPCTRAQRREGRQPSTHGAPARRGSAPQTTPPDKNH
jgi:hypothetical protein